MQRPENQDFQISLKQNENEIWFFTNDITGTLQAYFDFRYFSNLYSFKGTLDIDFSGVILQQKLKFDTQNGFLPSLYNKNVEISFDFSKLNAKIKGGTFARFLSILLPVYKKEIIEQYMG